MSLADSGLGDLANVQESKGWLMKLNPVMVSSWLPVGEVSSGSTVEMPAQD